MRPPTGRADHFCNRTATAVERAKSGPKEHIKVYRQYLDTLANPFQTQNSNKIFPLATKLLNEFSRALPSYVILPDRQTETGKAVRTAA